MPEKTMNLEIRKLMAENLAEFKALRLEALATNPESFGSNYTRESIYSDEKFSQLMLANEQRFILGAFLNNELVAMMGIMNLNQEYAQIWGVFARPEVRNHGVGIKILSNIIETTRKISDTKYIRLGVTPQSPAAIKLYEKVGFERYEAEEESGILDCEIIMKLEL